VTLIAGPEAFMAERAWLVEPILQVGHRCARLPGASHPWPATPLGLIILTLACLFGAWVIPRLFRRVWLTLLVAVALAASLLHAPLQPGWPPSDWAIVACDVGQGDAVVVRVGAGQALLLDTGPPDADLAVCLRGLGIRQVPMVILSHYHADHAGGLPELLAGWPVGLLLVNQTAAPGAASALALAEAHGTTVMVAQTGQWFTLGEATVEVVSPAPRTLPAANGAEDSSAENDLSLVVRVEVAGVSLLATGDLETAGQQALVRRGVGLGVDILKVPHHGSARQDDDFLAATGARIALISVGQNNSYGHPAASTITRLQRLGMTIARTDEHGSAAVWRQDNDLAIVTQR
jgi:competence protein ComEC